MIFKRYTFFNKFGIYKASQKERIIRNGTSLKQVIPGKIVMNPENCGQPGYFGYHYFPQV